MHSCNLKFHNNRKQQEELRRQKSEDQHHQVKFVNKDDGWAANIKQSANQEEEDPIQQQISNVELMLRNAAMVGKKEEAAILQRNLQELKV